MLNIRLFLVFLCLIGFCRPVEAGLKVQAEEVIAPGLVLVSAEFGLIEQSPDGAVIIKAADTIPLTTGQAYGWRLRFRTQREGAALREELELPIAPKVWNSPLSGQGFKVSPDGRTGITELDAEFNEGVLMNAWQVADGDPTGDHVLRLYVEGKLVRTFKFKVEAPK
jgi:hypothetical protein